MNIHEHQAKELLKEFNAPISKGIVIYSLEEIDNKITQLNSKRFVLKHKFMRVAEVKLEV